MADPSRDPAETEAALAYVVGEARRYLAELPDAPVRLAVSNDAAAQFGGPLPEDGSGTLAALEELLGPGLEAHVRSGGPRFFHWVMGGSTPAALAGDWIASLLDQNAGGWEASPLATQLETVALRWLRDLFGLPAEWSGVLVTGGQMANYTGLAAARRWWAERHGVDIDRDGFGGVPPVPVFTSGYVHVTAKKAAAMLGLGRDRMQLFSADDTGRLDARALDRALAALDGAPAIVIGNAGEVNSGAFDPIHELADLAERYGAWLHVDGAFGLFAAVSPRTRQLLAGVERASSVSSDGHKWLNVPFDCGFTFVRDPTYLQGVFSAGADYLPEPNEERPMYAFMGPELSRRARAFAVWATLRAYGRSGYRAIVERCLDNAATVARAVEAADDLELLAPVPLNIVCFRYRPQGLDEAALDDLNLRIGDAVLGDGRVYVGTTRWRGKVAFRPAFVNWRTQESDALLTVETVRELGAELRGAQ